MNCFEKMLYFETISIALILSYYTILVTKYYVTDVKTTRGLFHWNFSLTNP